MILPPAGEDLPGGWTSGYWEQDDYPPSSYNSFVLQVVPERAFPHQSRKSAPENSQFAKPSSCPYLDVFLKSGICKAWRKFVEESDLKKREGAEVNRWLQTVPSPSLGT